jgi:hypothetical protein
MFVLRSRKGRVKKQSTRVADSVLALDKSLVAEAGKKRDMSIQGC